MILDVWGWCTEMTQRDGTGREEGGGFRTGNTCIPVVDTCWSMAKPIIKIKKKNFNLIELFPSFYDSDSPPSQPLYKSQSTPPSDCWLPHLFLCSLHSGLTKNALREVTDDHILAKCCEDILFLTFSVALPPCWNPTFSCLAPVTQPIWFSCCLCDFPGCQSF